MKFAVLGLTILLLVCVATKVTPTNLEEENNTDNLKKDYSFFSSMMNIFNPSLQKNQEPKGEEKLDEKIENQDTELNLARSIFQALKKNRKNQFNGDAQNEDKISNEPAIDFKNNFPLELLLPKRRDFPRFGDEAIENSRADRKRQKQNNQFDILNKFLEEVENKENSDTIHWANPVFKDKAQGDELPFSKIFGQRQRGRKKHSKVDKQLIENLLQDKVPFFEGGHIVSLHEIVYKRGVGLKIDYLVPSKDGQNNKTYAISAKFKPKIHDLSIISMKEKISPFSGAKSEVEDIVVTTEENDGKDDFQSESDGLLDANDRDRAEKELVPKDDVDIQKTSEEKIKKVESKIKDVVIEKSEKEISSKGLENKVQTSEMKQIVQEQLTSPQKKKDTQTNHVKTENTQQSIVSVKQPHQSKISEKIEKVDKRQIKVKEPIEEYEKQNQSVSESPKIYVAENKHKNIKKQNTDQKVLETSNDDTSKQTSKISAAAPAEAKTDKISNLRKEQPASQ